jgi:hypothetical protein
MPDAKLHAPNENLHLPTFGRGIETSIWFMRFLTETALGSTAGAPAPSAEFVGSIGK